MVCRQKGWQAIPFTEGQSMARKSGGMRGTIPPMMASAPEPTGEDALGAPASPALVEHVQIAVVKANQPLPAPSAQEQEQVARWMGWIEDALKLDRDEHTEWRKWRAYASGEALEKWTVTTNIVESTLNALLPHVYARNPEVDILPSEAVSEDSYHATKRWARTARVLVYALNERARLKIRLKRMVRSAFVVPIAWCKVAFQTDTENDPLIHNKLLDVQHNLRRISEILDDLKSDGATPITKAGASAPSVATTGAIPGATAMGAADVDGGSGSETDSSYDNMLEAQAELQQQMAALQANVEVQRNTGMVIDTGAAEDLIFPCELREIGPDYLDSPWIAQRIWYTEKQAETTLGLTDKDIAKARSYAAPSDERTVKHDSFGYDEYKRQTQGTHTKWVCCFEIWDKTSNTVFTIVDGIDQFVRPPFVPSPQTERFYPFFVLAFHPIDGRRYPISDVKMIYKLQDEYSRTRSNFAKHRERAVPSRIARGSQISESDANKLRQPDINELVVVEGQEGDQSTPLSNHVAILPYPQVDPGLYNVVPITFDLEQVIGLQDANRGAVQQPKTATEAEIMQNSLVTRITERQDVLEDMMYDMTKYVIEYTAQAYTQDDVIRFCGMGAVWPQMPLDQIYKHLNLEIRAGTTGRPMRQMEQQNWAIVSPQIQQTIVQIDQLQKIGNQPLADAMKALLKETLRRLDVRIDVDLFIPPPPQAAAVQQIPFATNPEQVPLIPYREPPLPEPIGTPTQPIPGASSI